MFVLALFLVFFLATATVAQSAERGTNTAPPLVEAPLCGLVHSVLNRPELQEEVAASPQDEESPGEGISEPVLAHTRSRSTASVANVDRRFFESSLVNWEFFEDLAPEQRSMIRDVMTHCGSSTPAAPVVALVFRQFNASQRATFVGVTHALLSTQLIDSHDGSEIGNALRVVTDVLDIQGESSTLPSDHQFQLIVRLAPSALQTLERANGFDKGENHVFHKDYPLSFRQVRRIGLHGQEAGLHFCITRDGHFAQIHIDYRFGLLHLQPSNSDVRANGNHQRHVDRWPHFRFVVKHVRLVRVALP